MSIRTDSSQLQLKWATLPEVPSRLRELPAYLHQADWAKDDFKLEGKWITGASAALNATVIHSVTVGAKMTFRIVGQIAGINFTRHEQSALLNIVVDGSPFRSIDLNSPWHDWVPTVLLISGLSDAAHEISLEIIARPDDVGRTQCWVRSLFVPDQSPIIHMADQTTGNPRATIERTAPVSNCINLLSSRDKNIGDKMSSPIWYFDALKAVAQYDIFSWHPRILRDFAKRAEFNRLVSEANIIIGGGGLLGTDYFKPALEFMRYAAQGKVILWGVGHNSPDKQTWRADYNGYDFSAINYELIGVRDYGTRFRWVPCSSCLAPELERDIPIKHEFGFMLHAVVKKTIDVIKNAYPDAPIIDNFSDFESVLALIGSCETVVTNSFHGTYWATLMGRRVIALPTASKFFSLKHPVPVAEIDDWRSAMSRTHVYSEALGECREANLRFAARVFDIIG